MVKRRMRDYPVIGWREWVGLPEQVTEKYGGLLDRVTLYVPFDAGTDAVPWAELVSGFRTTGWRHERSHRQRSGPRGDATSGAGVNLPDHLKPRAD